MNKRILDSTKDEIKSEFIENVGIVKQKRKESKLRLDDLLTGEVFIYSTYGLKEAEKDNLALAFRLCRASDMRAFRLYTRIRSMIKTDGALFATFTFNDRVLNANTEASLRKYMKRFLESQCERYVANIDFGKSKNRLHYHAVCVPRDRSNLLDLTKWHKYGAIRVEAIKNADDTVKVGKYINKLTNHALKDNGFYNKLIYSRKVVKRCDFSK